MVKEVVARDNLFSCTLPKGKHALHGQNLRCDNSEGCMATN